MLVVHIARVASLLIVITLVTSATIRADPHRRSLACG
jgi:hypothetical protein